MASSSERPSRSKRGSVRERTRALLLDAAVRVFARKGAGAAAIHEITAEAGLANGTFYNYFRSREELLAAASLRLAHHFDVRIATSREPVADPAERVAIGCRRFVLQALHDPAWGGALLRVWASSRVLSAGATAGLLVDLRAGRRRGRFVLPSEHAAVDLVQGTVLAGMRTVLEGRAAAEHAASVAFLVLRGLGLDAGEAEEIVRRPLPPFADEGESARSQPTGSARSAGRARLGRAVPRRRVARSGDRQPRRGHA